MIHPIKNQINSVFVHVSDLHRSARWYSNLLGLELKEERLDGGPVYWMELEGYTDLLLDDNRVNKQRAGWSLDQAPLFMYVADDMDAAYRMVSDQHIPITLDLETPHEGLSFFNFRDLDRNVLMVCTADNHTAPLRKVAGSPIKPEISAVFVNVTDMERAAAFHFSVLGLEKPDVPPNETIVPIPVEQGADILLDNNRYVHEENYHVLFMFDTEDIDVAYTYVQKQGIRIFSGIERHDPVSFFTFVDPDDNVLMVCQSHEM